MRNMSALSAMKTAPLSQLSASATTSHISHEHEVLAAFSSLSLSRIFHPLLCFRAGKNNDCLFVFTLLWITIVVLFGAILPATTFEKIQYTFWRADDKPTDQPAPQLVHRKWLSKQSAWLAMDQRGLIFEMRHFWFYKSKNYLYLSNQDDFILLSNLP